MCAYEELDTMTDSSGSYAYEDRLRRSKIGTRTLPVRRSAPPTYTYVPRLHPTEKRGMTTFIDKVYRKYLHLNYKVYEVTYIKKRGNNDRSN